MTHRLMAVVSVLAIASGCVVTSSSNDGGSGGTGGTGGSGAEGATGGTGGTGANGGTGGTGAGAACETVEECDPGVAGCVEPTCDAGVCGEQNSAEGVLCDAGVCDGAGACVECIDGVVDCEGGDECVDGVCTDTMLGGDCGPNFCEGSPANNACVLCIQGNCQMFNIACANDTVAGACTNCLEFLGGGDQTNFCAGSQEKAQDLIDCACSAPCAE